jgi:hypothetical protein
MAALQISHRESVNPLDRIEKLARFRSWQLERTGDDEAFMRVAGGATNLLVWLEWRREIETLHLACAFETRVPKPRRDEMVRLIAMINEQMMHGHFDIWREDGSLMFRHSLVLAGGAHANDAQCETLVGLAVQACQRYHPAVKFVAAEGREAAQALQITLFETMGEA